MKRTINWDKYEPKVRVQEQNRYLDLLINPSFQGVNRLFAFSFENNDGKTSYMIYYLPLVEIKGYNVVIDGRNFLNQSLKSNLITFERSQWVMEMITQLVVY